MRIIVCGGRNYKDAAKVASALDAAHRKKPITAIIQGGADGADRLAAEWAWDHEIPVGTFNADWKAYGRKAGPIRNAAMIAESRPDGVIAFPGGTGTADMIKQARTAGLTIWQPYEL